MAVVLVVDDMPVDRQLAGGLLEQAAGLEIQYAVNGAEALEKIRQEPPDLVVTDLQMPELNGLELVTCIRMAHPDIPVILMTAKGSEAIAIEALEHGAASYVPKSELGLRLQETVENVLAMSHAERTSSRLMECQQSAEFSYLLDNDLELIDAAVELVQQVIEGMSFADHTDKLRIGVAVCEALNNAVCRGNLEIARGSRGDASLDRELYETRRAAYPYCDRRVFFSGSISPEQATFVVRDEGPGFAAASQEPNKLSSPGSLAASSGRGIVLMRTFMDEVSFNDVGNEVTLVKRSGSVDRRVYSHDDEEEIDAAS